MTSDDRFVDLLNDYLEGELDEGGFTELRQLLESDDRRLQLAADSYQTHRLLGLVFRDRESETDDFVRETMSRLRSQGDQFVGAVMRQLPPERRGTGRMPVGKWLAAIAATALLVAGVYFLSSPAVPEIVTISQLRGAVQWTGEGGQVTLDLAEGRSLCGGTLESLTPDSWVELTFRDGSTVTIPGRSALTISEHEPKELHLQHGRLSARIAIQPVGKPMLVYTPTAELEVVGTQFNVDTEPSATILAVNEGLVRLTRLTDGKVVEVPSQHQTIATIDQQDGFTLTHRNFAVKSWRADLAKDTTCGKWTSALTSLGLELKKAVASGRMTRQEAIAQYRAAANLNDEPGVLYATPWPVKHSKHPMKADVSYLVVVSVARGQAGPVVLDAKSRLRIRGRLKSAADVTFGVTTNALGGGFTGKYSVTHTIEIAAIDGNFEIELPVSELRALAVKGNATTSPIGRELVDWWCITANRNAGLAITHVELLATVSAP